MILLLINYNLEDAQGVLQDKMVPLQCTESIEGVAELTDVAVLIDIADLTPATHFQPLLSSCERHRHR